MADSCGRQVRDVTERLGCGRSINSGEERSTGGYQDSSMWRGKLTTYTILILAERATLSLWPSDPAIHCSVPASLQSYSRPISVFCSHENFRSERTSAYKFFDECNWRHFFQPVSSQSSDAGITWGSTRTKPYRALIVKQALRKT
ncbi:hypothetical protein RRG08_065630 [Elysia crispata]|uniref:Uncharacterized protein n=1 Tax=Elysia crispata TaxID=231223 RepID=A0AAE0YMU2_9GAST|nr:hypothetical protein RRG08_065630 [Elysia crispata]